MTLAIMQPYIFPYIGYFQLINAVDKFVIYDDVNFIKQGWINRNNILVQGKAFKFAVPLKGQSSFSLINEVQIDSKLFDAWLSKFLRTIEQSYKKAPHLSPVLQFLEQIFKSGHKMSISNLASTSFIEVSKYIGIETEFVMTSSIYNNANLSGKERVIDICKREEASHYINPIGGRELYSKEHFGQNGLNLSFIQSLPIEYRQIKGEFVPWLSIIDVLMFNSADEAHSLLNNYALV